MKDWLAFVLLGCPIKRVDAWAEDRIVAMIYQRNPYAAQRRAILPARWADR